MENKRMLSCTGSLSVCSQEPGLGQGIARTSEFNTDLLCAWQGLKHLGHWLLPPRVHITIQLH